MFTVQVRMAMERRRVDERVQQAVWSPSHGRARLKACKTGVERTRSSSRLRDPSQLTVHSVSTYHRIHRREHERTGNESNKGSIQEFSRDDNTIFGG
jgi:hypothetical protein